MIKTKQYRNEWKYVCQEADITYICQRLGGMLDRDPHGDEGRYSIHSLYFDDFMDSCVLETEAGVSKRFKYRIRYYGDDPKFLSLERKEKLDGRCFKKSCRLSLEQYRDIICGDYEKLLFETDNDVLRQFCICARTRLFTPRAIIDYERTAYVEPITNIRVTADRNISVSGNVDSFLSGDYLRVPVMLEGKHVLEVKFDHILPRSVRNVITHENMIQTSFSKYYLGRKRLNMIGGHLYEHSFRSN